MPPIDPNQLLKAFDPLLDRDGGIKSSQEEVRRLSTLMQKYSKKLVSRCTYCNVLMATTTSTLDELLKRGGWNTLNLWIKGAKERDNIPFLIELLKLMKKCPMTLDRLKENDTAKIVKSLSKSDDETIASIAGGVVKSWMKLVKSHSESKTEVETDKKRNKKKEEKDEGESGTKKRKLELNATGSAMETNSDQASNVKAVVDVKGLPNEPEFKLEARPSTVKVKLGKSRSIGLASSELSKNHIQDKIESNKPTPVNKVPPLKLKLNNSETNDKSSSPTGYTPVELTFGPSSSASPASSALTVLTESTGFMEAISTPMKTKKKRRSVDEPKKSKSQASVEALPEESEVVVETDLEKKIEEDIKTSTSVSTPLEVAKLDSKGESNNGNDDPSPYKSILLIGRRSTNTKRVSWREEMLQEVKFFDLDEMERTNVTKATSSPNNVVGQMTTSQIEISREKEAYMMSKKPHPSSPISNSFSTPDKAPIERMQWRLFIIDLPHNIPVVAPGASSKEKFTQRERQSISLQSFFPTKESLPDAPQEADAELNAKEEITKDIPFDDVMNPSQTYDYSNLPLPTPKTNYRHHHQQNHHNHKKNHTNRRWSTYK